MVLSEPSEALGNRSEIVRILVLAMTTAVDDASGSNFVSEVVVCFSLFNKQNGAFWLAKSKTSNFSFKDVSRDLQGRRKPYKFGVQVSSNCLCSVQALSSIQRDHFMQTSLSEVCSMYCEK